MRDLDPCGNEVVVRLWSLLQTFFRSPGNVFFSPEGPEDLEDNIYTPGGLKCQSNTVYDLWVYITLHYIIKKKSGSQREREHNTSPSVSSGIYKELSFLFSL